MKKILVIKVDTNDADYASQTTTITDAQLAELLPIFKAIKGFKSYKTKSNSGLEWTHNHNWPSGECLRDDLGEKGPEELYNLTEEQVELFEDFAPRAEYGFHTIEEIKVLEVSKETKYL